jgi:hypothetical protein
VCQVSCHRSFHTLARKARIGWTVLRSHGIPVPVRRASTTTGVACSTIPEPRGQPARGTVGDCIRERRVRTFPTCSRTSSCVVSCSVTRSNGSGPRWARRVRWDATPPGAWRGVQQHGDHPESACHPHDSSQSAPSITAQTSPVGRRWRRRVSASARSGQCVASVRRANDEWFPAWTLCGSCAEEQAGTSPLPGFALLPMLPLREAPTPQLRSSPDEAVFLAPWHRLSRGVGPLPCARPRPLCPVSPQSWRVVSGRMWTPRKSSGARRAPRQGIHLATCTSCPCCRGARVPGRTAHSSSMGTNTRSTRRTGSGGSDERHVFASVALHGSRMLAPCVEWRLARGALQGNPTGLCAPCSTGTLVRSLWQQMHVPLHQASMHLVFAVHTGRVGGLCAMLFHR